MVVQFYKYIIFFLDFLPHTKPNLEVGTDRIGFASDGAFSDSDADRTACQPILSEIKSAQGPIIFLHQFTVNLSKNNQKK